MMNKSVSRLEAALIADTFTSTSSNQQTIFTYPLFSPSRRRFLLLLHFSIHFSLLGNQKIDETQRKHPPQVWSALLRKLWKIIINTASLSSLINCEALLIPRGFKMTRFRIRKSRELPSFDVFWICIFRFSWDFYRPVRGHRVCALKNEFRVITFSRTSSADCEHFIIQLWIRCFKCEQQLQPM